MFVFFLALRFAILRVLRAGVFIVAELVLDVVEVGLQVLTLLGVHLHAVGSFGTFFFCTNLLLIYLCKVLGEEVK